METEEFLTKEYDRGFQDGLLYASKMLREAATGRVGEAERCDKHPESPITELYVGEYGCEKCFVGRFHGED